MAVLNGGAGNDSLRGTAGADTIRGYGGRDTLDGGHGRDYVDGGAGADILIWNANSATRNVVDTYLGGTTGENYDANLYGALSGGDRLHLGTTGNAAYRVTFTNTEDGYALDPYGNRVNFTSIERLQTGAGNDRVVANNAPEKAARGSGADYVPAHGLTVNTGAGNDYIYGSRGDDVLDGGAGNDTIYGGDGIDLMMPSEGNDFGHAGAGDDNVRWGNNGGMAPIHNIGNDTLVGGAGMDLLNVWAKGNGVNSVGAVVNFSTNHSGTATYVQGNGRLTFREFEQFWTHEGNDTVSARNAKIAVNAPGIMFNTRWGNDRLTGSNGRDTLEGGDGADTIDPGRGNDLVSMYESVTAGGIVQPDAYRDILVPRDGGGVDTIRGFQVGDVRNADGVLVRAGDRMNVMHLHDREGNVVDVNDVQVTARGNSAVLTFPNGEQIILEGVAASSLDAAGLNRIGIPFQTAQASRTVTLAAAEIDTSADDTSATVESAVAQPAPAEAVTDTTTEAATEPDPVEVVDSIELAEAPAETPDTDAGYDNPQDYWWAVVDALENLFNGNANRAEAGWQDLQELVDDYRSGEVAGEGYQVNLRSYFAADVFDFS